MNIVSPLIAVVNGDTAAFPLNLILRRPALPGRLEGWKRAQPARKEPTASHPSRRAWDGAPQDEVEQTQQGRHDGRP